MSDTSEITTSYCLGIPSSLSRRPRAPVASASNDQVHSRIVEHVPRVGIEEPRSLHHCRFPFDDIDLPHRIACHRSRRHARAEAEHENIARRRM